jgi:hypothetical protein
VLVDLVREGIDCVRVMTVKMTRLRHAPKSYREELVCAEPHQSEALASGRGT